MTRSVALHLHAQYRAMLLDPEARATKLRAVHAPPIHPKTSPLFIPDSASGLGAGLRLRW